MAHFTFFILENTYIMWLGYFLVDFGFIVRLIISLDVSHELYFSVTSKYCFSTGFYAISRDVLKMVEFVTRFIKNKMSTTVDNNAAVDLASFIGKCRGNIKNTWGLKSTSYNFNFSLNKPIASQWSQVEGKDWELVKAPEAY